jgi:hypothetical protein
VENTISKNRFRIRFYCKNPYVKYRQMIKTSGLCPFEMLNMQISQGNMKKLMPISTSAIFVTGETKPAHAWKKKRPFATVALKPISKN